MVRASYKWILNFKSQRGYFGFKWVFYPLSLTVWLDDWLQRLSLDLAPGIHQCSLHWDILPDHVDFWILWLSLKAVSASSTLNELSNLWAAWSWCMFTQGVYKAPLCCCAVFGESNAIDILIWTLFIFFDTEVSHSNLRLNSSYSSTWLLLPYEYSKYKSGSSGS